MSSRNSIYVPGTMLSQGGRTDGGFRLKNMPSPLSEAEVAARLHRPFL